MKLDNQYHRLISKYLQHCTTLRSDQKRDWDTIGMFGEIEPIVTAFEKAFPA